MNNRTEGITETNILKRAIDALVKETGIQIQIKQTNVLLNQQQFADALITVGPDQTEIYAETKHHAAHANIGAIINQVQRLPGNPMFVADYINPVMAKKLKYENIQYLDTAGNAFINLEPVYILILGKKQNKHQFHTTNNTNRAFEPKGLIVTYAFLTDPNILNLPYREIAVKTGVAVGTVGWVINALKAGKYIHDEVRTKKRRITNYQRLLDRWVEAWPEKLKPKYLLGTFVTDKPNWWENTKIRDYKGYWGGETAGAIYTKYLKPETTTIYIPKIEQAKLIREIQLTKADDLIQPNRNIVHMFTPFWVIENDENKKTEDVGKQLKKYNEDLRVPAAPGLVNPVLAYADLVATGDNRNLETARILYEERIAK